MAYNPKEDPPTYEEFVKTTDLKVDADDDIQFYFDGYNEEHGEVSGVIKRMRRGDYDKLRTHHGSNLHVSEYLIEFGLKETLEEWDECRGDLMKEIGDEHWYLTRFLQVNNITWDQIERINMMKLNLKEKESKPN